MDEKIPQEELFKPQPVAPPKVEEKATSGTNSSLKSWFWLLVVGRDAMDHS